MAPLVFNCFDFREDAKPSQGAELGLPAWSLAEVREDEGYVRYVESQDRKPGLGICIA